MADFDPSVPQSFIKGLRDSETSINASDELKDLLNPSISARQMSPPISGTIKKRLNREYEYFWARDRNGQDADHSRVEQLRGDGWEYATTKDVQMTTEDTVKGRDKEGFSNETASRILRLQGLDKYKDYLISFEPEKAESSLPKLQIFPDCNQLRKCIPLCIYDKKSNVTNKPAEDVREFDGDDPYDTLRYLTMAVDKYLGTLRAEGDHREKVNQILEKFEKSKDYNFLYRAMERVEHNSDFEIQPVKRYHGARR